MPYRYPLIRLIAAFRYIGDVFRHVVDASDRIAGGIATGWAVLGAIDANTVQLWGGVVVALSAALWGHFREQRRRDFVDAERRKLLKILVDANESAIKASLPLPYPEVVTMLVSGPAGISEERKETAPA